MGLVSNGNNEKKSMRFKTWKDQERFKGLSQDLTGPNQVNIGTDRVSV
jgi:hypothetical protein